MMYTSATENKVYKALVGRVEHIFINGQLYKVQSYAYGIDTPVTSADDFHEVCWSGTGERGRQIRSTYRGRRAGGRKAPEHRVLLSEEPIKAIWLRLRQLQSVIWLEKWSADRAQREQVAVDGDVLGQRRKAWPLRSETLGLLPRRSTHVSQRILNLYYGSLAFAFAEMLASPNGANTLGDIENSTKQGHGLYTLDGTTNDLEHLVVGVIGSGFFPSWMKFLGMPTDQIPARKPVSTGISQGCQRQVG